MPDAMDIPSWSDSQAARQRFFDRLTAAATLTGSRRAWRVPVPSRDAEQKITQRAEE